MVSGEIVCGSVCSLPQLHLKRKRSCTVFHTMILDWVYGKWKMLFCEDADRCCDIFMKRC